MGERAARTLVAEDPKETVNDIMMGGTRAVAPNRWRQLVWTIGPKDIKMFEAEFSWEGKLEALRTLVELPTGLQ